ncbi:MAG: hypothetical protein ACR2QF_03005 [Geminicoccaceae bacterium]
MASKVGIWNAALIELGQKSVIDEAEDTASARLVRERYESVREALLTKNNWTFATKRAKLPRLLPTPEFGWTYFYQLPAADYLTLIGVWDRPDCPRGHEVDYQLEDGLKLATDAEEIWIKYVNDLKDPNLMTPQFREAVSGELAAKIANRVNELSGRRQDMIVWANKALNDARSADAQANSSDRIPDDTWLSARLGGAWRDGPW